MSIARLTNASKFYGPLTVLGGVSLEIPPRRRIGVAGRNGTGKTTLFRLLTGEIEPDEGEVWVSRDARVSVLEQIPTFDTDATVESVARSAFDSLTELSARAHEIREQLASGAVRHGSEEEHALLDRLHVLDDAFERRGGFEIDFRIRSVLCGLGFSPGSFDKKLSVMSGGEKNRLALARALLVQPDLLLLDEPTNHLDLAAIEWLESYLRSWREGFLLISHDRFLLEAVTEITFDVANEGITVYPAPYRRAMEMRDQRRAEDEKRYRLQRKEIARQEDFVQRNIAGQSYKQAISRRRRLEKMERLDRPEPDERQTRIRIQPRVPGGRDVLMVDGVRAAIGGRELLRDVSFHLSRGDRVGILGPNGCGKTTLLRILSGQRPPDGGSVTHGVGVMIGFLDQELRGLSSEASILEEIQAIWPLADQGEMRGYLARFLFVGDDVFRPIHLLSGGERCRVALAKLFLDGPNLIFLDEPTNHLDIDGREALEAALADYTGTVVAVSHDRAFLSNFATTIMNVEDGGLTTYLGGFAGFQAARDGRRLESGGLALEPIGGAGATESGDAETRDSYEARKQEKREREKRQRARRRRLDRIGVLEAEIAGIDERLESAVARMSSPELDPDARRVVTEEHAALQRDKADRYEEWERLVDEVESSDEDGEPPAG